MNTSSLPIHCSRALLGLALGLALLAPANAADCAIPRDRHPWAAFRPGSWKLVKVTTETFDENGKSTGTSVTETRTMLLAVDNTSYELQIDVTVDVAGKRLTSQPRVTRQGFHGEGEEQRMTIRRLPPAVLKVADRSLSTQVCEIEITDKSSRKVIQLNHSGGVHPYVLARHSTAYDAAGKVQQQTDVETKALQIPRTILSTRRMTWQTRTTQKHVAGSVVTDEVHCFDVPGGVVEHTSEETDDKGRTLRKSKLELVNYGVAIVETTPKRRPRKSRRKKNGVEVHSFTRREAAR